MGKGPCSTSPCLFCRRYKRYREVMANGSRSKLRKFLTDVFEHLYNVEAELDLANAVLDGSWPTAVEQLEEALKTAKEKRLRSGWSA